MSCLFIYKNALLIKNDEKYIIKYRKRDKKSERAGKGEGILNDALAHSARERCVLNYIYRKEIKSARFIVIGKVLNNMTQN